MKKDAKKKTRGGVAVSEDTGIEPQNDGRKIPFCRVSSTDDYAATFYGSEDATAHVAGVSLLVRHERRGTISWGIVACSSVLDRGPATNKLQGQLRSTEANNLFQAVRYVLNFPSRIFDTGHPNSPGREIAETVMRDIVSGDASGIRILEKCIEAAHLREEQTKADRILDALVAEANRLQRIPTWQEVRDQCEKSGYPYLDDSNFRKDIKMAGLNWLIVKQ